MHENRVHKDALNSNDRSSLLQDIVQWYSNQILKLSPWILFARISNQIDKLTDKEITLNTMHTLQIQKRYGNEIKSIPIST